MRKKNTSPAVVVSRKEIIIAIFLLAAAVFTVFSPALDNEFTNWDDDKYVTANPNVKELSVENVKKIFTSVVTKTYCPLTVFSFAIEYHFHKLNPFFYILDNILIHIAVTALIFIFGLQLGLNRTAAFVGALLFGVHPLRVESVVWITERKDVLYSFFYMLAVCSYMKYLKLQTRKWFVATIVLGFLSVLSKGMAWSLPLVLLLLDWFTGRKFSKRVFIEKLAFVAYLIPIGLITASQHARVVMTNFLEGGILAVWSFTFNIKKFFWPYWLCPVYNVPQPIDFTHTDYALAGLILAALIYILVRFRDNRWVKFAFFYYLFSMFFLIHTKQEIHISTVADRFMYLPSAGICLWLGYLFNEQYIKLRSTPVKQYALILIVGVVFSLLAIKSYTQCAVWKNSTSLWEYVLKYSPCSTAFHNRGLLYMIEGNDAMALKYMDDTIKALPSHDLAWYDKGFIYNRQGKYDLALQMFDQALSINPRYYRSYHNKANIYLKLKKYDLALENCRKALEINPTWSKSLAVCSEASYRLGQYEDAAAYTQKAQDNGFHFRQSYLKRLQEKLSDKKTDK